VRLTLIIFTAVLLLLPDKFVPLLNRRFLPLSSACFWIGAAITAAGLLSSVWARHHLGNNWSQAVTLKKDHELITADHTGWFAIPSIPGFCWQSWAAPWLVANGAVCLR
jgi:protein-S-isoprenylcysteine O-methyltransferase Ste14